MQLFIDQPTTVGLSYTVPIPAYTDKDGYIIQLANETCPDYAQVYGTCGTYSKPDYKLIPNNTQAAAPNVWKTIQGFMGAFPNYTRSGISFATESYGGHYGPVFNGMSSLPSCSLVSSLYSCTNSIQSIFSNKTASRFLALTQFSLIMS